MERHRVQLGKLFFIVIATCGILFFTDKLQWIAPVREIIEEQIARIRGQARQATITEKLQQLEATVAARNEELKRLQNENEEFRKQLQAPLAPDIIFIPAVIISTKEEGEEKLMNVAIGSAAGVKEGMPVVYESILIGRVVRTSSHSAVVRLLSSVDSKIAIKTNRGTQGLIIGTAEKNLYHEALIDRVLQDEPLQKEDTIFTSGEDGLPADLLVGTVIQMLSESREPFQKARVTLRLDPNALTHVFIIDRK